MAVMARRLGRMPTRGSESSNPVTAFGKGHRRLSVNRAISTSFALLVLASAGEPIAASAGSLTYDAVADFNTTGVQSAGAWAYGTETAINGAFTLFPNFAAIRCSQDPIPCLPSSASLDTYYYDQVATGPAVVSNNSGGTITFPVNPALIFPGNVLGLGPGSTSLGTPAFTVVRWTAPESGEYNISGFMENLQAATTDQYVYVDGVQKFSDTYNGSLALQQEQFSFSNVFLTGGGTVDFLVDSGGDFSNQGDDVLGLSATITSATPEPGSLGLLTLGIIVVVWQARSGCKTQ
jgi:hypothetical protein